MSDASIEYKAERLPGIETSKELRASVEGRERPRIGYTLDTQSRDNGVRAANAAEGLIAYARPIGLETEELTMVFGDFLGDLRHLADAVGVDWDAVDERGQDHYRCELYGTE